MSNAMYLKDRNEKNEQPLLQLQRVSATPGPGLPAASSVPYPLPPCGLDHSLFIRDNRTLHRVPVRDLLHVEADGNYVELALSDSRYVLRNSLAELLKAMPDGLFVMVNRRQAVNLLLVDSISTDEVTIGRNSYTLSPRYRDQLLERVHVVAGR